MPYDQLFQFTHLCIPEGAESLKDDLVDAMELAKLWREFLAEDSKNYSDEDGRKSQQRRLVEIIAKAGVISGAFFTDVSYEFSPEEIAALQVGIKNPIKAPPNRATRRQINRLDPSSPFQPKKLILPGDD